MAMILLIVLQFTAPLLLVAWLGFAPGRTALGFWAQVAAVAAGLLAIGLIGLWAFPPWWTPHAIGVLFLIVLAAALRRRPFASLVPSSARGWFALAASVALAALGTLQAAFALAGRLPPEGEVVELTSPLERGAYLVVNGGSDLSINAHMETLDESIPRYRDARGQSYGVDLVAIDRFGLRAEGLRPPTPSAYHIYGVRVLAPCAGEVIGTVDGLPDMQVPLTDRANLAGNHVWLRCGGVRVLLAHLRPGSVQTAVGARVQVGDVLGAVGNSGNSDEPHLHIHVQTEGSAAAPMSGEPLPMRIDGRFLVRNDRVTVR